MSDQSIKIASLLVLILVTLCLSVNETLAQVANGISSPTSGDVISGIVVIEGSAQDPSFLRYELAFKQEFKLGSDWIVFAQGDQPVVEDTLAIWDTTVGGPESPVFPDGRYQIRLRVVRQDYNYDEYLMTGIILTNQETTPTAEISQTPTLEVAPTRALRGTVLAATVQAGAGILPTLTPFPTPSPLATPLDGGLGNSSGDGAENQQEEGRGLLERLNSIDLTRFGRAFWLGVAIVAIAFTTLALYILVRGLLRWLWRLVRSREQQ